MNISVATEGLSANESGDFRLVCRLYEMVWSDFEVRVECEVAAGSHRTGRKLIHVRHRVSRRHRTYRAGEGSNWLTAFEEDVKAHCFTSLFQKPATIGRRNSNVLAGGFRMQPLPVKSAVLREILKRNTKPKDAIYGQETEIG